MSSTVAKPHKAPGAGEAGNRDARRKKADSEAVVGEGFANCADDGNGRRNRPGYQEQRHSERGKKRPVHK
jgi:hypothetical protein